MYDMVSLSQQSDVKLFITSILVFTSFSFSLPFLNWLLYTFITHNRSLLTKKSFKRSSTYELRVNSVSTSNSIRTIQYLNLASLFLVFNVKVAFLIPYVIGSNMVSPYRGIFIIIFMFIIMYSLVIKVKRNILSGYKNREISYLT